MNDLPEMSFMLRSRKPFNLCDRNKTISRTDEGQPRPKYIFNKCRTNIYFFTLQRFGPSPSPKFKYLSLKNPSIKYQTMKYSSMKYPSMKYS